MPNPINNSFIDTRNPMKRELWLQPGLFLKNPVSKSGSINLYDLINDHLITLGIINADPCCEDYIAPNSFESDITAVGDDAENARQLTAAINNVTESEAGDTGVKLPVATAAGVIIEVTNSDAVEDVLVYPETGGNINAAGVNVAYTIAIGVTVRFVSTAAGIWTAYIIS